MNDNLIQNLGPLAALAGIWAGDKGVDVSWIQRRKTETTYRE